MSALERMKCGSCAKDSSVTPLKDDEVVQHSSQLPLWSLDPNGGREHQGDFLSVRGTSLFFHPELGWRFGPIAEFPACATPALDYGGVELRLASLDGSVRKLIKTVLEVGSTMVGAIIGLSTSTVLQCPPF